MIIPMEKMQTLHKAKQEALKKIIKIDKEIASRIKNCKHNIIKQGECISIAVCTKCGKHFGWWCPESKNGVCEYKTDPYNEECIHCGQPEERK